jgi:tetratricopeptide (TPR) repeat protein
MAEVSDEDIYALVAREQRAFRRILFAGVGMLALLVILSCVLAVYYFQVERELRSNAHALRQQAHDVRSEVDRQNIQIAKQVADLKADYDDLHGWLASETQAASADDLSAALQSADTYLRTGARIRLADERTLQLATSRTSALPAAEKRLLSGAMLVLEFDRTGGRYEADQQVPVALREAKADFETAGANPAYAVPARAGVAMVFYRLANAENYPVDRCQAVISTVGEDGTLGPRPLYWRAQCQRKLGLAADALKTYATALEASFADQPPATTDDPDTATLTNRMNAYHGLGTTLIAASRNHLSESDAEFKYAIAVARRLCKPTDGEPQPVKPMHFARACLDRAILLRRALGQTPSQVTGSQENLGLALLLDQEYRGALENFKRVNRISPTHAWNQIVGYLAARHLGDRKLRHDTRENISLFKTAQFNVCELHQLLPDDLFNEARAVIEDTHPHDEPVTCPTSL